MSTSQGNDFFFQICKNKIKQNYSPSTGHSKNYNNLHKIKKLLIPINPTLNSSDEQREQFKCSINKATVAPSG